MDDSLLVLIFLGICLTFFVGSILGIIAFSQVNKLRIEVTALKLRLLALTENAAPNKHAVQATASAARTVPVKKPAAPPITTGEPVKASAPANIKPGKKKAAALKAKQKTVPSKPTKAQRTFEETIGTQWTVWVGGLALLLGAVFLLRYTIEAGFFTPAMRIIMASLFGVGLLGTGEFLRRIDPKVMGKMAASSAARAAYIPGILTAVGIFTLLGSIYAAYELYGFIGPITAFALMGATSLIGMALGLLHGPSLAALGLAASLATPLLIQTDEPNAYALYAYLLIVCFASLRLAHLRRWGPLKIVTLFGALGWVFISLSATSAAGTFAAWSAYTAILFTAATVIALKEKSLDRPFTIDFKSTFDPVFALIWTAIAALAIFRAGEYNDFEDMHYYAALGASLSLMLIGWRQNRHGGYILIGGLLAGLFISTRAFMDQPLLHTFGALALLGGLFVWLCFSQNSKPLFNIQARGRARLWSGFGAFAPLLVLVLISLSNTTAEHPAAIGLTVLTLVNAGFAFASHKRSNDGGISASQYALGAGLAYMFAVIIPFDFQPVSLGFMAGIVITALATVKLPIRMVRLITAGFALLTAAHVLLIQIAGGDAVGERIIFNALWLYLALPAFLCAACAWVLSKQKQDLWSEGIKALALTFTALFAVFQIRHIMNGGDLLAARLSLEELALQILVGLCFTLGGSLIEPKKITSKFGLNERFIPGLAMIVSVVTLAAFVIGLCFDKNPLLNNGITIQGGFVFNTLALAYLLPAFLLGGITALSKGKRPEAYIRGVAALSFTSFMIYVTAMIRKAFSGKDLSIFMNPPKSFELYAMSAAWLLIGVALLVAGLKAKRKDLRIASGVIITLTVLKAFLIDMATLEGVLRAMSFVVLGLILIVIGRTYQRILATEK